MRRPKNVKNDQGRVRCSARAVRRKKIGGKRQRTQSSRIRLGLSEVWGASAREEGSRDWPETARGKACRQRKKAFGTKNRARVRQLRGGWGRHASRRRVWEPML